MPTENAFLGLRAGQIVLAGWRGDARPKEPNKRRPAVVIEVDWYKRMLLCGLARPAQQNLRCDLSRHIEQNFIHEPD